MNKVAVFGNAGGGKSTLSKRLADMTGFPWVPLDSLKYQPDGGEVPHTEFKTAHDALFQQDQWIIDGLSSIDIAWERLGVADIFVNLDMLVLRHYWWVTKRLLERAWVKPDRSPRLKGTLNSYTISGCAIPN